MIVVFDLDGTLVDSSRLHSKILEETAGVHIPPERIYDASSLKMLMMGNLPSRDWDAIKAITRKHESELLRQIELVEPMPGVYEALTAIKHRKAIFTSANRRVADAMLKHCFLKGYFDLVVTADDVRRGKPDPEGLFIISKKLKDDFLVVVGNSEKDVLAAKKFGAVSMLFKNSPARSDVVGAEYTITDLRQLPELLKGISLDSSLFKP